MYISVCQDILMSNIQQLDDILDAEEEDKDHPMIDKVDALQLTEDGKFVLLSDHSEPTTPNSPDTKQPISIEEPSKEGRAMEEVEHLEVADPGEDLESEAWVAGNQWEAHLAFFWQLLFKTYHDKKALMFFALKCHCLSWKLQVLHAFLLVQMFQPANYIIVSFWYLVTIMVVIAGY